MDIVDYYNRKSGYFSELRSVRHCRNLQSAALTGTPPKISEISGNHT
jgi:hypothetical protein